jgi:feruloyl-CoA synthase
MLTGLGMTETAPFAICANAHEVKSGHIGLPAPGIEIKLVPDRRQAGGALPRPERHARLLARARADAECFDAEGFYCSGDAAKPMDPADPGRGFMFDGRIAEDFKLTTGTFVSVGPLRAKIIAAGDPLVQDVVIAGINRSEIGVLFFPRLDACRAFAELPADAPAKTVLAAPKLRAFFQRLVDVMHSTGSGSATRGGAGPGAGPAALDRQGRDHRQGLDQPARRC